MKKILSVAALLTGSAFATSAFAGASCDDLPGHNHLKNVLTKVTAEDNGGRGHLGWLTLVDSEGVVCAVVNAMEEGGDVTTDMSGIGHRESSARKANTSVAFSNNELSIASGNLYVPAMPGGQLFLTELASLSGKVINGKAGSYMKWGTKEDPMVGKRIGGFFPAAGGLALYTADKKKAGAIGVSGDTFCTSHVVAWKVRERLSKGAYGVANIPAGIANGIDALIQDIDPAKGPGEAGYSASGFGYVTCADNPTDDNDGGSIMGNEE